MVGEPICEVDEGDAATARGLMFCTGGFDRSAARVISLEESAAVAVFDKDRVVTGEGAFALEADGEAVVMLLLRCGMDCPLTSLSNKDPPVVEPVEPAAPLLLGCVPLLPSSTGITLSLLLLFSRA